MIKKCRYCGAEFETAYPHKVICDNPECKKQSKKESVALYLSRKKAGLIRTNKTPELQRNWTVRFQLNDDLKWSWYATNLLGRKLTNGGFVTRKGAAQDFTRATGEVI